MNERASATQQVLVEDVRQFVAQRVDRIADAYDESGEYPFALVEEMKSLGLFGLTLPIEAGGLAATTQTVAQVFVELARGWLSLPALLGSHLRVVGYLDRFGTESQRAAYLPLMARGDMIAAHAFHEPGAKSPVDFQTCLRLANGRYLLSGKKAWVTNARHADVLAVVARIESDRGGPESSAVALVRPDTVGVCIGEDVPRIGIKGVSLAEVELHECPLEPASDLVGGRDCSAEAMIGQTGVPASLSFAARAVGLATAIVDETHRFLVSKRGESPPLADNAVVRSRFAAMMASTIAAKALLAETLRAPGKDALTAARLAKVFCTDAVQEIAKTAMQLHGGSGYAGPGPLKRYFRDASSLVLIDTPNDVLLEVSGQRLLAR